MATAHNAIATTHDESKNSGKSLYSIQRGQCATNVHPSQNSIQLKNSLVHNFTLFHDFGRLSGIPARPDFLAMSSHIVLSQPGIGKMRYCYKYQEKAYKIHENVEILEKQRKK